MEIKDVFSGKVKQGTIKGWIQNKRSSGGVIFLILRDGTGFLQATLKKDKVSKEKFEELKHANIESTVEVSGKVKRDERAPGGYELEVLDAKVLFKAEPHYPLQKQKMGVDYLLNNRHLWIRSEKMHNIMRVRAKVLEAARDWFKANGFLEVQVPTIVSAACEGGSTLFKVDYFGKPAYLTQSWQLYGEAMIQAFGKCYTIAPSFRAEKSRTRRHLTEYWHLEAEMPFCGLNCLMKIEEQLITHIINEVTKSCRKELEALGRNVNKLLKVKPPFPKITYTQAVEILKKDGIKIKWGEDFGADEELVLTQHFDVPFFVTHYPREAKAFYHKPDPTNPKVTLSVDLLAPEGYGEIAGGGERIETYEQLMERIKENKLNPKDYQWYLDLRKWGACQHAGFGLGVERFVMWICKLDHIRDAIAFPRLINRVYP